jgi:hypothetical protein
MIGVPTATIAQIAAGGRPDDMRSSQCGVSAPIVNTADAATHAST